MGRWIFIRSPRFIEYFPVISDPSYGSTAPLAALPKSEDEKTRLLKLGWDERPVGRPRLQGLTSDPEYNVLKELLSAETLLQRREVENREYNEQGMLQLAYLFL